MEFYFHYLDYIVFVGVSYFRFQTPPNAQSGEEFFRSSSLAPAWGSGMRFGIATLPRRPTSWAAESCPSSRYAVRTMPPDGMEEEEADNRQLDNDCTIRPL